MTITLNGRLDEEVFFVQATSLVALTGAAGDGVWVSLENYSKITFVLDVLNATTVTAGAVTLQQATTVAGAGAKALPFTRMVASTDIATTQVLTETVVTNNTFSTDTTNSRRLRYVIEVSSQDLDTAGGFDCVRLRVNSMVNAIGVVSYILWGARYSGISPLVD